MPQYELRRMVEAHLSRWPLVLSCLVVYISFMFSRVHQLGCIDIWQHHAPHRFLV